jgi:hypothetical protein
MNYQLGQVRFNGIEFEFGRTTMGDVIAFGHTALGDIAKFGHTVLGN